MATLDKKGKHLTQENRINILNELIKGTSLLELALKLGKDSTTISKEIKLHRYSKQNNRLHLTIYTKCAYCSKLKKCKIKSLCNKEKCNKVCKSCSYYDIPTICKDYSKEECKTTKRFPYTCHSCQRKNVCILDRYFYDPNIAQKEYKELLTNSRSGINMNKDEFDELDNIIYDGIRKGKSIYSIVLNNPFLPKSERTIYRYIGNRYLKTKDVDLRNKVKMKPRKSYKDKSSKEKRILKKEIISTRNYEAYLEFLANNRTSFIPQLDLVQGTKGDNEPYLMTFIFPFSNLMFGFLIPNKGQKEIVKVFNHLESTLGKDTFMKLFPACLTDRGNEFLDADGIELSSDGSKRTNLFYCDPYSSSQKPEIERNHEFFRYYSPKGKSLKEFTQEEINLIFSHINSYNRKIKDGKSPYEIFSFIYGEDILDKLNIKKINFNDIDLTRNLVIKFRSK